jgi:2-amino-4-hydroxy-6-hydroxymethyldihydropteridine diphosphokinase
LKPENRDGARQAVIGVGANLGDRWATISCALDALAATPGIAALESSAVYETMPVGLLDQPKFLNLVAGIETTLAPRELLAVLHAIETAAGRRRDSEVHWGPRPLDLDLLLYEGEVLSDPDRMWERAFVLVPLRELLGRSTRFERAAWKEIRTRLSAAERSDSGVERWYSQPSPCKFR